jgi:hypothetical protein
MLKSKKIFESDNNSALPYETIHLDNSKHYFKSKEDFLSWNNLLYDFKPWFTYKDKSLYRTRTLWFVKINGVSTAVKFEKLSDALKELLYFTNIIK